MNKVGNETEKKAAFANTRITNQQYLERVIIVVIPYFWTHNSFLYYSTTQKLFSFFFSFFFFPSSVLCKVFLFSIFISYKTVWKTELWDTHTKMRNFVWGGWELRQWWWGLRVVLVYVHACVRHGVKQCGNSEWFFKDKRPSILWTGFRIFL